MLKVVPTGWDNACDISVRHRSHFNIKTRCRSEKRKRVHKQWNVRELNPTVWPLHNCLSHLTYGIIASWRKKTYYDKEETFSDYIKLHTQIGSAFLQCLFRGDYLLLLQRRTMFTLTWQASLTTFQVQCWNVLKCSLSRNIQAQIGIDFIILTEEMFLTVNFDCSRTHLRARPTRLTWQE